MDQTLVVKLILLWVPTRRYLAGEDPKLGAVLAPRVVAALQAQRVIANGKHYVDNSQEDDRNAVTEVMDERTQWEIFYPAFQAAADAGLMSIMCSCVLRQFR